MQFTHGLRQLPKSALVRGARGVAVQTAFKVLAFSSGRFSRHGRLANLADGQIPAKTISPVTSNKEKIVAVLGLWNTSRSP